MDKIQYCLKEILLIQELLKIPNPGFFKRLLSRLVAIRVPDFINFGFIYNKSLPNTFSNKQKIKDELNALLGLYHEFMKLQRDKLGSHFQDLEFLERIELWLKIDFSTLDFFIDNVIEIYKLFSTSHDYKDINLLNQPIDPLLAEKIRAKNEELNIENNTYASSDILGLSRFNNAQMMVFSEMNIKASVLKSIEIIVNYDLEMLVITSPHQELHNLFKEMSITDVINYYDNLFTRVVPPGSPQEMDGFDKFINDTNHPETNKIINDFKNIYKSHYANDLRDFRNKLCGHIDKTENLITLLSILDSYKVKDLILFYRKLENLFKKICFSDPIFTFFRSGPVILRGISSYNYRPEKPFDQSSVPETEFIQPDYSDISLYGTNYKMIINNENYDEARYFFYKAFLESDIVLEIKFEITANEYSSYSRVIQYRKSHKFFFNKLIDPNVAETEKEAIIKLFGDCKTGYPDTLSHILLQAYPIIKENENLAGWCINAFGELGSDKMDQVFKVITDFYDEQNGVRLYQSLLALYKIDLKDQGMKKSNKKIEITDNEYSLFLKGKINRLSNFLKITLSMAFLSELFFTHQLNHFFKSFEDFYVKYFRETFENNIENLFLNAGLSIKPDLLNSIKSQFNNYNFTGVIILIAEFFEENEKPEVAKDFYNLIINWIVKTNENDNFCLSHIGYIFHKSGNNQKSIEIFRDLVERNPDEYKNYMSLMGLYKEENMIDELKEAKEYVLANYNLDHEDKKFLEDNF